MTTMLEKMARAMRDSEPGMEDKSWRYWVPSARAALQAIREPDDAMIEAGESAAWDKGNSMPTIRAMPIGFTAMIDAILSEQPEP